MNTKLTLSFAVLLLTASCIRDEAPNPEADILDFAFPVSALRTGEVEIYNDYIVAYPAKDSDLRTAKIETIEVTPGATWKRVENTTGVDTLFFIDVTSESREYTKRYSITQVENFPDRFDFETWVKPSTKYQYENPKEGSMQWYSSNNGAAIAWAQKDKPAEDYLVRKINVAGGTAAEMRTMVGPGDILGNTFIPCLAGSLYLGGFNPLTGLSEPLKSTSFGVPFDGGKPLRLTGEYIFREGTDDYINHEGDRIKNKRDYCSIYAVIYKTDKDVQFLYGDNVGTSSYIIARAELKQEELVQQNTFTRFDIEFDYDSYSTPFRWDELLNNEYKVSIVFSSSHRGQHYEGRPGNTLIVDDVQLHYEERITHE